MHGFSRQLARRPAGDDGVALVVSTALVGIVTILIMATLTYTLQEVRATGRDRQRSSAVTTADGQLDLLLSQIQDRPLASLPCGVSTPASPAANGPDDMNIQATITYYAADGATVIPCASLPTTEAATALVTTTATAATGIAGQPPSKRSVETLLRLTPAYGNSLNKAMFGDAGIQVNNSTELFPEPGKVNADIYTNGDMSCANSQTYHGSIYAQGSISLQNSCRVDVDAWAGTGYTSANSVSIGGNVKVSAGNATAGNSATVGGQIRASGTVGSASWCSSNPGKCVPGVSVGPVPSQTFPVLNWDAATQAAWAAQGWTDIVTRNTCSGGTAATNPQLWLIQAAASMPTTKTIVVTTCTTPITMTNSNTITLRNDLAVFSPGGFLFRNSTTVRSNDSSAKKIYLIQPFNARPRPCTPSSYNGIQFQNSTNFETPVEQFLYSPCSIDLGNSNSMVGQIYSGGTLRITNSFNLTYKPLPVWGVMGASSAVESYKADMQWKREKMN